ncbi:hypothetical protein pb186bvf_006371 [Paramecium bursaria]
MMERTLMMGGKNGQKQVQNTKKISDVLKIDKEIKKINPMPIKSKQEIEEKIKQTIKQAIQTSKKTTEQKVLQLNCQSPSNSPSDSDSDISYKEDADKSKSYSIKKKQKKQ